MVLAELGRQINGALQNYASNSQAGDDELKLLLNEVARALLAADVNIHIVKKLQQQVRAEVATAESASGLDRRKVVQQALLHAVHKMVDPGVKPFVPKKGVVNVVMFVGLQGGGKTTSCTKYAAYFQRQGLRAALVCADTYRAGAYDQLRQNALKAGVRFYGSITETDPVVIAREGVAEMRKERFDLIIVDTSGRNKQEAALFEEMRQVEAAIQPKDIVYVLDGTNGQAVHEQASEFKAKVRVGSVILTKMDCDTKGGGALSAVATTNSPIIFVGTGEHFDDFLPFSPDSFVSRMLGRGDVKQLAEKLRTAQKDSNFKESQQKMMKNLSEGAFTMRDLGETIQSISRMGSLSSLMEMIPGMSDLAAAGGVGGEQSANVMKGFIHILDSMTPRELENPKIAEIMTATRISRIARGSGKSIMEVNQLLGMFKQFEQLAGTLGKDGLKNLGAAGGMGNMLGGLAGGGAASGAKQQQMMQKLMGNMMGGMGGMPGMPNMSPQQIQAMQKMMGGGGGAPGPAQMAKMMQMAKSMGLG